MTSLKGRTLFITGASRGIDLTCSPDFSGHFLIDEDVLSSPGVTDLDHYNYSRSIDLQPDLFVSQPP